MVIPHRPKNQAVVIRSNKVENDSKAHDVFKNKAESLKIEKTETKRFSKSKLGKQVA